MSRVWSIEWHASLPSTMARARELAEAGAPDGTVIVADYQSAGRGTGERAWLAPPGTCLMFTLVARPAFAPAALEDLPRGVAESVAAVMRADFGLACELKAPNDVLVDGRKLCGVLCASRLLGERIEWLLCGIGLNTFMRHGDLPVSEATSLAIAGVKPPPHPLLLERLLARLEWLRGA